jgi:prepilin-type N-terminal cleavage/methylation domain-containing protein
MCFLSYQSPTPLATNDKAQHGFTLAELLIALVLLGLIASFTIPKVLESSTNAKYKAMGKEAAAMLSGAFQVYKMSSTVAATTGPADLTQFMNYVRVDTSGATIDNVPYNGSLTCNASAPCLRLHNGGALHFDTTHNFAGTAATNAIMVEFDPDGTATGNPSGAAVDLWVYTNGRIRTSATIETNTTTSFGSGGPDPTLDPPWFSWSN